MTKFELLSLLERGQTEPDDMELFARCVRESMEFLDISFLDLASRFTVSVPSIKRWAKGTHAPHPVMRAPVFSHLIKLVLSNSTGES